MSNSHPASQASPALAPPRSFSFAQVDVFAEHALEGNALAIFPDARGLSDAEMQSIARETNLSETTFILPRPPEIEQERGVHVRIFLTTEEVPFAGHPTLGTASWLYSNHPTLQGSPRITLELGVGPIPVDFEPATPGENGIFGTMKQNDPRFGETYTETYSGSHTSSPGRAAIASALGLSPDDLDPNLPPQWVSTGMAFCIVPLRTLEAASRMQLIPHAAREILERIGAKFFYCITRADAQSGADWHARLQFHSGEDAATGSAAGSAISYLVRHGVVPSGQSNIIEQGIEMHRPSRIHVRASLESGTVTGVFVGGRTIAVASGQLFLP
ncbi:MAG: PhzF family phenazine biosynthesis protein [Acidobacteriota bacterium]|nr:PhzF family phenazine biosynthesis protein [Acidobacteriota bacterium]